MKSGSKRLAFAKENTCVPGYLPNAEFVSLAWGSLTQLGRWRVGFLGQKRLILVGPEAMERRCGSGEILDPCQPAAWPLQAAVDVEVLPAAAHRELSAFGQAISERLVGLQPMEGPNFLARRCLGGVDWLIKDFPGFHRHRQEAY